MNKLSERFSNIKNSDSLKKMCASLLKMRQRERVTSAPTIVLDPLATTKHEGREINGHVRKYGLKQNKLGAKGTTRGAKVTLPHNKRTDLDAHWSSFSEHLDRFSTQTPFGICCFKALFFIWLLCVGWWWFFLNKSCFFLNNSFIFFFYRPHCSFS